MTHELNDALNGLPSAITSANAPAHQPNQWPVPERLEVGRYYWQQEGTGWKLICAIQVESNERFRGPINPPPNPKEPWEVALDNHCTRNPGSSYTRSYKEMFQLGYELAKVELKDGAK